MRLCALHELPDGTARGFDPRRTGQDTMFVVREGDALHAWADACPHHGTPMAWAQLRGRHQSWQCHLSRRADVPSALQAFEDRRWERCRMVVENSSRLCQIEIEDGSMDEHAQIMRDSLMALAQPI
jgi:hypothetical protein